jgi:hypothetical protein
MVVSPTSRANPNSRMEQPGWSWSSTVVPEGSVTGRARSTNLTLGGNDYGRDPQEKNKRSGPSGLVRRLPAAAVRAIPGLRGRRPGFAPVSCARTPDGRLVAFRALTCELRPVETAGIDVPHRTGLERSWRSGMCGPSSRVQPGPKSASNLARRPPPVSSHWRTENRTHLVFHVHGIRPSTSTAQAEFQGGGRKLILI